MQSPSITQPPGWRALRRCSFDCLESTDPSKSRMTLAGRVANAKSSRSSRLQSIKFQHKFVPSLYTSSRNKCKLLPPCTSRIYVCRHVVEYLCVRVQNSVCGLGRTTNKLINELKCPQEWLLTSLDDCRYTRCPSEPTPWNLSGT